MSLRAEVVEEVSDIEHIKWTFDWWDVRKGIVLDRFSVHERKTKRHKFRVVSYWTRLGERDNRIKKPVVPVAVIEEAVESIRLQINYESETK